MDARKSQRNPNSQTRRMDFFQSCFGLWIFLIFDQPNTTRESITKFPSSMINDFVYTKFRDTFFNRFTHIHCPSSMITHNQDGILTINHIGKIMLASVVILFSPYIRMAETEFKAERLFSGSVFSLQD